VNQERHTAYAGYQGLINLGEQISNSMKFYRCQSAVGYAPYHCEARSAEAISKEKGLLRYTRNDKQGVNVLINPRKHSQSIGAAMAFQGVHNSLPIIHGAQGCSFLAKVLLTKHFREPVALASTKLFTENVVMGSEDDIANTVNGFIEKNGPDVIGIFTSGLSEVKGDDVSGIVKQLQTGKGAGGGAGT
jgi:nitrogenase molybdenum-iron protein alpha/beta subunit